MLKKEFMLPGQKIKTIRKKAPQYEYRNGVKVDVNGIWAHPANTPSWGNSMYIPPDTELEVVTGPPNVVVKYNGVDHSIPQWTELKNNAEHIGDIPELRQRNMMILVSLNLVFSTSPRILTAVFDNPDTTTRDYYEQLGEQDGAVGTDGTGNVIQVAPVETLPIKAKAPRAAKAKSTSEVSTEDCRIFLTNHAAFILEANKWSYLDEDNDYRRNNKKFVVLDLLKTLKHWKRRSKTKPDGIYQGYISNGWSAVPANSITSVRVFECDAEDAWDYRKRSKGLSMFEGKVAYQVLELLDGSLVLGSNVGV